MKSKFFLFVLIFIHFKPIFSEENLGFQKAFIVNPNGLVFYKSKGNIEKKGGVLEYGDEIWVPSDLADSEWTIVKNRKGKGEIFIQNLSKSDLLVFSKPNSKKYALLKQNKIPFLEKPFLESKSLLELKQFDWFEILGESNDTNSDRKWFWVKLTNKQTGFLSGDLDFYDSLSQVEEAKKIKRLILSAFAKVENPKYWNEPELKTEIGITRGASKKGEFIHLVESKEVNGVKYYKTSMANPSRFYKMQKTPEEYEDFPFEAWISEKDVTFFSNSEFTKYTMENSNYKGDKAFLEEIYAKNPNYPLNFRSVRLEPITSNKSKIKSSYSIVKVLEGYTNQAGFGYERIVSFIVKEEDKKLSIFSGNIEDRGKIEILDLDEDGIPEFFTQMNYDSMSRVAFTTPLFYGLVDGIYKSIPLPGNFLEKYTFEKNILYVDTRNKNDSGFVKIKYKYKNGKFIKIK